MAMKKRELTPRQVSWSPVPPVELLLVSAVCCIRAVHAQSRTLTESLRHGKNEGHPSGCSPPENDFRTGSLALGSRVIGRPKTPSPEVFFSNAKIIGIGYAGSHRLRQVSLGRAIFISLSF